MKTERSITLDAAEESLKSRLAVRPQVFNPLLPIPRIARCNTSSITHEDMSTVQTWTLWQRMPPRYQLTTKGLVEDGEELVAVGNAPERSMTPRREQSPRPYSAQSTSSRPQSRRENCRDFVVSGSMPEAAHKEEVKEFMKNGRLKSFSFPKRHSDYVNTYQKQRRVNSARRRLAEVPCEPTTAPRAHTAPVFPITNIDTHKVQKQKSKPIINAQQPHKQPKQNTQKHTKLSNKVDKGVSPRSATTVDVFQFNEAKSVTSSTSSMIKLSEEEPRAKKYVVQDTSKATVYIDNGKVMYFGKSRHDLTQLLKTQSLRSDRGTCFLAELRRDYLKHPKYENGRGATVKQNENDPRRIAHERVDYNRRVEHILSYYDERPQESSSSQTRPTSGRQVFSPRGGRVKGLVLTPANAAPSRPPSPSVSPELVEGNPNDFITLNKQSKLHDRQFYLRTPGAQHGGTGSDQEKCRCSMCRSELQLDLVTGQADDPDVAMVAAANAGTQCLGKPPMAMKSVCVNKHKENIGGRFIYASSAPRKYLSRTTPQRVTFQQVEDDMSMNSFNTKVRIKCTLPEVTDMPVSESGFESCRTQDGASSSCSGPIL